MAAKITATNYHCASKQFTKVLDGAVDMSSETDLLITNGERACFVMRAAATFSSLCGAGPRGSLERRHGYQIWQAVTLRMRQSPLCGISPSTSPARLSQRSACGQPVLPGFADAATPPICCHRIAHDRCPPAHALAR